MRASTAATLLALALCMAIDSAQALSWKTCGMRPEHTLCFAHANKSDRTRARVCTLAGSGPMTPSSVTLVPDPAVAGKTFAVTVPGMTSAPAHTLHCLPRPYCTYGTDGHMRRSLLPSCGGVQWHNRRPGQLYGRAGLPNAGGPVRHGGLPRRAGASHCEVQHHAAGRRAAGAWRAFGGWEWYAPRLCARFTLRLRGACVFPGAVRHQVQRRGRGERGAAVLRGRRVHHHASRAGANDAGYHAAAWARRRRAGWRRPAGRHGGAAGSVQRCQREWGAHFNAVTCTPAAAAHMLFMPDHIVCSGTRVSRRCTSVLMSESSPRFRPLQSGRCRADWQPDAPM